MMHMKQPKILTPLDFLDFFSVASNLAVQHIKSLGIADTKAFFYAFSIGI